MMHYWSERFPARLFVPVAAAIAAVAQASGVTSAARWAIATAIALLLLAQFRLLDDLADRHRDRASHPERVLAARARVTDFKVLCATLAAMNVVLLFLWSGWPGAASLLVFNAGALAWYAWRPLQRAAGSDLVPLCKYPAFVLLLAFPTARSLSNVWLAALAAYAIACAYEVWHDRTSPLRFSQ
jgi:4-hydroxybenzoate polyprenyltransferase